MEKQTNQKIDKNLVADGMDIFVTNYVADGAAAILYERNQEILLERFSENYLAPVVTRMCQTPEQRIDIEQELSAVYHVSLSYGGIYLALWNMTKAYEVGFRIVQKDIPIHQETIEICNFFDVNPYGLYSPGVSLFVAQNGILLAEKIQQKGLFVKQIGKITKEKKKVFLRGDEERFLERPKKDPLMEGK